MTIVRTNTQSEKKKKKMSFEYEDDSDDDDDERMLLLDMLELNPSDCIVQPFLFDILHSDMDEDVDC